MTDNKFIAYMLVAWLLVAAVFTGGFVVGKGETPEPIIVVKKDGLRALPSWDYTNRFPDINMEVTCTHRGKGKLDRNKGAQVGDVLVARCEASKLSPPGPVG